MAEERIINCTTLTRADVEAEVRASLGDLCLGHIEVYRNVITVHVANQFGEKVTEVRLARSTAPAEVEGVFLALEMLLAPAVAAVVVEKVEIASEHADYLLSALPPPEE